MVGGVMGKIAILSAGNTGIAAALHVSSLGYNPMVYTRNAAKLAALQGSAISSTGVIDGLWKIHASDNLAEVLDGADFIIICTWANNHNDVFKNVRDWAKNNPGSAIRLIVFNGNWGAYEAFQILAGEDGIQKERLTIAESTGMPYVSKFMFDNEKPEQSASLLFTGLKSSIEIAYAINSDAHEGTNRFLSSAYSNVLNYDMVFATSLMAPNPIIHAPLCLLNMTRIESGSEYYMLSDGFTERTEQLVRHIDGERHNLANALKSPYIPITAQLNGFWGSHYLTLTELFKNNPVYSSLIGPKDIRHRFIQEDIPYGIAPLVALGNLLGGPTPTCEALLTIYRDYFGDPFEGPSFDKAVIDQLQ